MAYLDDEAPSGSGEDGGNADKHESVTPSASGKAKKSPKATGDAIVEAMVEIAAASKMRAAVLMKNEDRFSITKCVQALDQIQGIEDGVYFRALDLFENPLYREMFISLKSERRLLWLQSKCAATIAPPS